MDMTQLGRSEKHQPGMERMQAVLKLLEPFAQHGITVTPDDKAWCVTISRKGVASECSNITAPDRYILSMANRVYTAEANNDVVN